MRHRVGVQAFPGVRKASDESCVPADPEHHLSAGGPLTVFGRLLLDDISSR